MKKLILLFLFLWIIIDKSIIPATFFNSTRWVYVIENENKERQSIIDYDGISIIGDKVEVINKKKGCINYKGLEIVR